MLVGLIGALGEGKRYRNRTTLHPPRTCPTSGDPTERARHAGVAADVAAGVAVAVVGVVAAAALVALVAVFRRTSAWARAAASRAAKRPTQGRPLPCRCSDGGGMPLLPVFEFQGWEAHMSL